MISNRRKFLRGILGAAAALPLGSKAWAGQLLPPHNSASSPLDLGLLDELERASFDFFWTQADPHTGLVRDRANADGVDARVTASIAATGFGLTALCIGHQRGYRARAEITDRVRKTLRFLSHDAPDVRGYLFHFVDMRDGKRSGFSEISPIDMAILLCGVLTCREYFNDPDIRRDATALYHRVDWQWAL
ncbi:MAG: hypothetical protein JOY93_02815, partial [Acidobacteriales bacterium]|nr:hypothetical protein [Terriglobales bacterium]